MRVICVAAGLLLAASSGAALAGPGGKADPRALEACKAQSKSFVQIAGCLPAADVAIRTLDAFTQIYPPEAWPIKAKCLELNADSLSGALSCVTNAIEAAIALKAAMPDGATLDDPVFNSASDASQFSKLEAAEKEARDSFPDEHFWGGGLYRPYQ